MSTEISKPSLPSIKWDEADNHWDEEDLFWDMEGYADIDKPVFKNYLLTQAGGFLLFQDGDKINIGGTGYSEITKPSVGVYTEISKPI